jgi:myxalamid-type polyketide synthase MxaE and MxaD
MPARNPSPLAIVGIGCRVKGAAGPDELWSLLRHGTDAVSPSPRRWWGDVYDPHPLARGKSVARFGAFLDDVEGADWRFFGISPREARSIDPQHRLLLEVTWEALEDAGMPAPLAAGRHAGVFVGIMFNDYLRVSARTPETIDGYTTQNNTFAYAANRISYTFDLRGPSMAIDTNCSASLVALHQACRSVWSGESEWALAGGVSLILAPDVDISMSKAAALSPTGRVRTWDAAADGFVRGEGAGLVLVKPLDAAIADGDRIYATILGTAANHKGRGHWIVEPSEEAQADVIRRACVAAGIAPEALDYVELHGTGTPKGDPIEAAALGSLMRGRAPDRPLRVGSIKTNLGHLDAAAGVAGVIKTALCLQRDQLVPSLHFEKRNPAIDLEGMHLQVQTELEPWPRRADGPTEPGAAAPPTAGVTAIGFGGTNAHAILRGHAAAPRQERADEGGHVLALSARSARALRFMARRYADWLETADAPPLADLAYTLAVRRTHHAYRLAVACDDAGAAASKLRASAGGADDTTAAALGTAPTRVVFVFPGHGAQWWGMARDLLGTSAVFAEAVTECDALARREVGWSIHEELLVAEDASRLDDPAVVQPLLFTVQVALARLWRSWGIRPDAVVGHSFGEIAAAVAAEILPLEDAVRIICARGRVTQTRAGRGGVAVVELPRPEIEAAIARYMTLEVGGENTPTTTLVTGASEEIEALLADMTGREVFARRVKLAYASHGRDMDGILGDFAAAIGEVRPQASAIAFASTVAGALVDGRDLDASYWVKNLREPVRFVDAVAAIGAGAPTVFVELGASAVLSAAVRRNLGRAPGLVAVLPSLQRGRPGPATLDEALGGLYAAGCAVAWAARYPAGRVVSTPTYPFQRERMWIDPEAEVTHTPRPLEHPLLGRVVVGTADPTLVWEQTIGGPETAYFRDHCLQGVPSASTSAMVEMMFAAASRTLGTGSLELYDVALRRAFILPREGTYLVQTLLTRGPEWSLEVRGRPSEDVPWRTHSTARVRPAESAPPAPSFAEPFANRMTTRECYEELADRGLQYGPTFHGIEWLSYGGDGVLAAIRLPEGLDAKPYFFHPAMHDAAMHVAVLAEAMRGHAGVLPVRIARLWIHARPGGSLRTHATVTRVTGSRATPRAELRADLRIENAGGEVVEIVEGIEFAHLDDAILPGDAPEEVSSWLYGVDWVALPAATARREAPPEGTWWILGDQGGMASALAERMRAAGRSVGVLTAEALERGASLSALGDPGAIAGVVHLASLDLPDLDAVGPATLDAALARGCGSALALVQHLESVSPTRPTPVWFVTRGAQAWGLEAAKMAPLQASLWGFARSAAAELPLRWGGLVDLDPSASTAESTARLFAWLGAPAPGEDEIALRGDDVFGARLVRRREHEPRGLVVAADTSYLVTGGTGGLGLQVAQWLVGRGARHVVLAARTGLPPRREWAAHAGDARVAPALTAIEAMERAGASVTAVSLDVSDHAAVMAFVGDHERSGRPPIRGVFHLAGTVHLEDITSLRPDALLATARPKVHGALALHRWLEDIDGFVLFSSASAIIRSPRLAHYAVGNAFLDALAHYRRLRGQPAVSIDWGLWSEVGFVQQLGERGPAAMGGMKTIAPAVGLSILERLLEGDDVQAVVWPPAWDYWAKMYPDFARASLVAELIGTGSQPPRQANSAQPRARESIEVLSADAAAVVTETVAREVARQLRLPVEEIPRDEPLERLGLDSVQATELQARLLEELGARIPILRLLGFASIATVADDSLAMMRSSERRLVAAATPEEALRAAAGEKAPR